MRPIQPLAPDQSCPPSRTGGRGAVDRPRRVLAVDDEPTICAFLAMILRLAGHHVWTAESGRQALGIARAQGDEIDLLITDLCMPGMTGTELATEMRALRPGLKTLFISGDVHASLTANGSQLPESAWLPKPFQFQAISETIQALFAAEPAA